MLHVHENGNQRATTLLNIEPIPFFLSTVHYYKHFADWEMLPVLLTYADLFSKHNFSRKKIRSIIWVSHRLTQDQAQHFVGPDLGPNSL